MLEEMRERLEDAWNEPWHPLGLPALVALLALFLLVALVEAGSERHWVPLLDSANLAFHEAGHPIFGIFGWETLAILGGTLMQLLVPLLVAGSFWWKRQAAGYAFGLYWAFQNLHNIARYMADARDRVLPLAGGGEHDWTELFLRWGCLRQDRLIAGRVAILGWVGMLAVAAWLFYRWRKDRIRL